MDKLELYRKIIIEIIEEFSKLKPVNLTDLNIQVVTDKEHDHYFLYHVGWDYLTRIHNCLFHIDIIDGKVWLQEDNTNFEITLELTKKGIPKSDIVIGFHALYKRPFTEFAVA